MISRQAFLTSLFDSLDANGVRYCVMRNYENLHTQNDTDVDLLVAPESLARFQRCLREAAARAEFRFVHAARYVNYSHVYWHPGTGFTRIDFETDVRWRLFTVLFARQVLDARQRHDNFFVPHPRHESAILFVAALWRGFLSERYRRRLAALYDACPDKAGLRRTFCEAFGAAGEALAEFQARVATREFDRAFCSRVRQSIIANTHRGVRRFAALAGSTLSDAGRFWERLRRPAGVSLLFASATGQVHGLDELMERIDFLFPEKKCIVRTYDLTHATPAGARWSLRLRLTRLRVLFKGGLFVRAYGVGRDPDLAPVIRTHARYLYPSCTFVCMEDSAGRFYLAHCRTGFMASHEDRGTSPAAAFSDSFIKFVSHILEHSLAARSAGPPKRGVFCVLVGLDGAGKTTLARNLCTLVAAENRFRGVRYFHWRPKAVKDTEFPMPEYQDLPRKEPNAKSFMTSLLSAARLVKNLLLARLAYWLRVRRLLRQGYLVFVDRYFYNYYLDPVSVKYSGPAWLLDRLRPFFPQPDVVVTLQAPKAVLLQRKQELSEAEILRQAAALETLPFGGARVVAADASQPADEVARTTMKTILDAADQP